MMNIKLLLLLIFSLVCSESNAQRRRIRSYNDVKQEMINTTVKLSEIRTYPDEKMADKVNITKTITFTEDSIVVTTNDRREIGIWVEGNIDFILVTSEGKKIKYDWIFGREGEPCYQVGDNKKMVECYQRLK